MIWHHITFFIHNIQRYINREIEVDLIQFLKWQAFVNVAMNFEGCINVENLSLVPL